MERSDQSARHLSRLRGATSACDLPPISNATDQAVGRCVYVYVCLVIEEECEFYFIWGNYNESYKRRITSARKKVE